MLAEIFLRVQLRAERVQGLLLRLQLFLQGCEVFLYAYKKPCDAYRETLDPYQKSCRHRESRWMLTASSWMPANFFGRRTKKVAAVRRLPVRAGRLAASLPRRAAGVAGGAEGV